MSTPERQIETLDNAGGVKLSFTSAVLNFVLIAFFLGGLYGLYSAWIVEIKGKTTTGTVIDNKQYPNVGNTDPAAGQYLYAPVVKFQVDNQTITFESAYRVYPAAYDISALVRVRYDPANPQSAEVDDWELRWTFPLTVLPATLIGLWYVNIFSKRKITKSS